MTKINAAEKVLRTTISLIGFPLAIIQTLLSKYEIHKYKQMGKLINIGTHSLHAVATGIDKNRPTKVSKSA